MNTNVDKNLDALCERLSEQSLELCSGGEDRYFVTANERRLVITLESGVNCRVRLPESCKPNDAISWAYGAGLEATRFLVSVLEGEYTKALKANVADIYRCTLWEGVHNEH